MHRTCTNLLFRSNSMDLMKFMYSLANANLHQIFTTKQQYSIKHPKLLSQSYIVMKKFWSVIASAKTPLMITLVAVIIKVDHNSCS